MPSCHVERTSIRHNIWTERVALLNATPASYLCHLLRLRSQLNQQLLHGACRCDVVQMEPSATTQEHLLDHRRRQPASHRAALINRTGDVSDSAWLDRILIVQSYSEIDDS